MKSLYFIVAVALFLNQSVLKAAPREVKEWTVLVFLNGHNNLDSFGPLNINQMETVGSTANTNVVVQWASLKNATTKRFYIQKDDDRKKISSPVVMELPRVDMGNYQSLVDFVEWAAKEYPAKHYFIDVWNHGGGWMRGEIPSPVKSISNDDLSKHSISTVELGIAMSEIAKTIGHRVDIFGADACLMAMVEIMNEISNSVDTFVGSEEVEPGAGWPYHRFLSEWNRSGALTGKQVGEILAREYVKYYQSDEVKNAEVTLSVIDLTQIDQLRESLGALSQSLREMAAGNKPELLQAIGRALSFQHHSDYVDVGDLLRIMQSLSPSDGALQNALRVKEQLQRAVVQNGVTKKYSKASGLSIWWPKSVESFEKNIDAYSQLKFSGRGSWSELLHALWQ